MANLSNMPTISGAALVKFSRITGADDTESQVIIAAANDSDDFLRFELNFEGKLAFRIGNGETYSGVTHDVSATLLPDTWYVVGFVYDSQAATVFYEDQMGLGTPSGTLPANSGAYTEAALAMMPQAVFDTIGNKGLVADLAAVWVYDRVLASSDVLDIRLGAPPTQGLIHEWDAANIVSNSWPDTVGTATGTITSVFDPVWDEAFNSVGLLYLGPHVERTAQGTKTARALTAITGKRYWEFRNLTTSSGTGGDVYAGVFKSTATGSQYIGYNDNGIGDPISSLASAIGTSYSDAGGVVMCAFDADTGQLWVGIDGVWKGDPIEGVGAYGSSDPAAVYYPALGMYYAGHGGDLFTKAADFQYDIPFGFVGVEDPALPDPVTALASGVFDGTTGIDVSE